MTQTETTSTSTGFQEDTNKLADKVDEVLDRANNLRNELSTMTNLTQKRKFANETQTSILKVTDQAISSLEKSDSVRIKEVMGKIVETFEVSGPLVASTRDIGNAEYTQMDTYLILIANVDLTSSEESLSFNMHSQSFTFNKASLMAFSTDNKQLGLSSVLFEKEDSSKASGDIMDEWQRLLVADEGGDTFVNSPILMITLNTETTPQLTENVSIIFELYETTRGSEPGCYSLTPKAAYALDPAGCTTRRINVTHISCSCNHLTSFAILMSVTVAAEKSSLALDILSYICCSLSILFLFLSFLTFVSFKALESDRNMIHTHLVICLGLGQLVFLIGIDQVSNKTGCAVIAGFLHFLFLASFFWMAMEGLQIYMKLVLIFETSWSMLPIYYGIGYGCPAIVVAISAGLFSQGYGHEGACWLKKEKGFQWSFIGPVLVVILWNVIMLSIALNAMRHHLYSPARQDIDTLTRWQTWLKGAVTLVFVLGLTWIFGIFNLGGSETEAFAYIFVLLNGSQGVFIFAFHCMGNDKVKKEYRRVLRKASWLPEGCRRCLFKCFSTPSSHEISQTTGATSAKGSLSHLRNSKTSVASRYTATSTYPSQVLLTGRSVQIVKPREKYGSEVDLLIVTPSQLSDGGVYLGEDDGNVYGPDEGKLTEGQTASGEDILCKTPEPETNTSQDFNLPMESSKDQHSNSITVFDV
ncbi:hypothetical protein V1264_007041 [Littorina saxatilis]|uniref:Uncharacterized protein n=2 Tax=Littorina saxatilis TaxID=31220 RepID=A0AAN9AUC4_9CAEN